MLRALRSVKFVDREAATGGARTETEQITVFGLHYQYSMSDETHNPAFGFQPVAVLSETDEPVLSLTAIKHAETAAAEREATQLIAEAVKIASDAVLPNDLILLDAFRERLTACSDTNNIWIADDLHSEVTGDLFSGSGRYWSCGSKLCSHCVAKQSRRARSKFRKAIDRQKLYVGEDLYFVTLTQVNPDLSILQTRELINRAWQLFRKRRYIRRIIAGYGKAEEFTVTKNGIHYHLHAIVRSRFIRYRLFRQIWTECVQTAFMEKGLPLQISNADGLLSCKISKIHNVEKALKEVCKYITKSDSWRKIRQSDLLDIVRCERFPRMFELGGSFAAEHEDVLESETTDGNTRPILDTEALSDAPRQRTAAGWRNDVSQMSFWQWQINLQTEIEQCKRVRRAELRRKYPFATFRTLAEITGR